MFKIGAHLSISGGYYKAIERIADIGGNCLQIFSSSPRGWNFAKITEEDRKFFAQEKNKFKIERVYFHASYLVNLAGEKRIADLSMKSLIAELNVASQLGIKGSIIHLGSYKENGPTVWDVSQDKRYSFLIDNILQILTHTPKDTFFIIENAGNRKIGQTIEEIAKIIKDINDERIKVCLDTCHLFSAGYPLRTQKELETFLIEFDKIIGLHKLELWHLNDSRDPFNALRDRHENIGEGTMGISTFKLLLNDSRTKHLPFIIETPGFDGKGPDKKNIDILKSLTDDK